MQVQLNTDSHVQGDTNLEAHVQEVVTRTLGRFKEHITRVEVHLNDENSTKGGEDDKRCMIEARLKGLEPAAVTHHAGTVHEALVGATDKLERVLDKIQGRRNGH